MEEAELAEGTLTRAAKLRRLHALTGVVPLGAFVLLHLWTTASILGSRDVYDRQMGFVHGGPILTLLELVLVVLPLAYHGLYGLWRAFQPREEHVYETDLLYTLERVSGVIVLVFIVGHFWELRWQTLAGGLPVASYSTKLVEHLSWTSSGIPWIALGYLVGIAATLFHLVNGMTSFCTTWGYTRTDVARRRANILFRALGVIFFLVGSATVIQLATGTRFFASEEHPSSTACGSAVPAPRPPSVAPSSSAAPPPAAPSADAAK